MTALLLYALVHSVPMQYLPASVLFFSALIVTVRTDLETMLISRVVTLFLIPVGLVASATGYLPISLTTSITGALLGYFLLWSINRLFYQATKQEGMGQGDMELLAFIGSFLGPLGVWNTVLIGSCAGSVVGLIVMLSTKSRKIPFGPFLAMGAFAQVLLEQVLFSFLTR